MSVHFIAETMCDRLVSCQFINEYPLRRARPGGAARDISGFCWLRQIMITVNPLAAQAPGPGGDKNRAEITGP